MIKLKNFNVVDWVASILVIIGGLNWGLVGFFKYDLVASVFGSGDPEASFPRVIFALVGLAALWMIYTMFKMGKE